MYVCKNSRGGHPLLRLWGLVYGIPQGEGGGFVVDGVFAKGRDMGEPFLNIVFFFFLDSSSIISGNRDLR